MTPLVLSLIQLGLPPTIELISTLGSLVAALIRRNISPPWAVGVAVQILQQEAANNPYDTGSEHQERCKAAIAQQLSNSGTPGTEQDVQQLYDLALQRIRFDLGLQTTVGQPTPTMEVDDVDAKRDVYRRS